MKRCFPSCPWSQRCSIHPPCPQSLERIPSTVFLSVDLCSMGSSGGILQPLMVAVRRNRHKVLEWFCFCWTVWCGEGFVIFGRSRGCSSWQWVSEQEQGCSLGLFYFPTLHHQVQLHRADGQLGLILWGSVILGFLRKRAREAELFCRAACKTQLMAEQTLCFLGCPQLSSAIISMDVPKWELSRRESELFTLITPESSGNSSGEAFTRLFIDRN